MKVFLQFCFSNSHYYRIIFIFWYYNIIFDYRWNPGLNGNEPSRYDFGMNMGLQLELGQYLGLIIRYNILEEKEESVVACKWPFFWIILR